MQKKLLAAAVAGALALPGVAMAQSAVTISGVFKVGLDSYRISNATAARSAAGTNTSETRITDNSSRLIFGITEDIGGGMSGIAQLDMRPQLDGNQQNGLSGGNSWVGVRSTSWGTVTLGRHDLHYGKQPDDIASKAGALMAASVSLMDFVQLSTGGQSAIANATRTNNVLRYDSPNWSGFAFTAAYSANPLATNGGATGTEADLTSTIRKGAGWNFNPSYTTSNWQVGWSYWNAKGDGVFAGNEQRSNVFYGYALFGDFKVGLALNKSKVESVTAAATTTIGDRNAWTIPLRWASGPHNVFFHYTKAGNNKATAAPGSDGARMWAAAYVYDLSKRTSVGLTVADINNDTNAAYNFFTNTGALGSAGSALGLGEDGRLYALTVRHAF